MDADKRFKDSTKLMGKAFKVADESHLWHNKIVIVDITRIRDNWIEAGEYKGVCAKDIIVNVTLANHDESAIMLLSQLNPL